MPLALMKSADLGPYQIYAHANAVSRTGFPDLRLAPVFIIRRARSPDLCVSGLAQTASAAFSGLYSAFPVMTAQAILAILLANATVTNRGGLPVSMRRFTQP